MIRITSGNRTSLMIFWGISFIILVIRVFVPNIWKLTLLAFVNPLLIIGTLWFIRKTLLFYIPDKITVYTLVLIAFATNLYALMTINNPMQQNMVLFCFTLLMYLTASWHYNPHIAKTILMAVISAITILIYPEGYLVLLIPVFWGIYNEDSWKQKYFFYKTIRKDLFIFIGILLVLTIIPILTLGISPGEISFLDFKLPGVFMTNFRLLWIELFSFNHGWLIYTPLMLIPAFGYYFFADRNRQIFFAFFITCVAVILAESCWTAIDSSPVFGQMTFMPLYGQLSLPIAYFLKVIDEKHKIIKIATGLICIFFIVLNLFQTWQYQTGYILKSGMTPTSYALVFGRTYLTDFEKQRLTGAEPDGATMLGSGLKFNKRLIAFYNFENTEVVYWKNLVSDYKKSGKLAMRLDGIERFSPAVKVPYSAISMKKDAVAKITVSVFVPSSQSFSGGNLVFSSFHQGMEYRYASLNLESMQLKSGLWHTVSFDYLLPPGRDPNDLFAAYVWYSGNSNLFIDDLNVEIFEPVK